MGNGPEWVILEVAEPLFQFIGKMMERFGAFVEKFSSFGFCRIEGVSALGFGFGGVGFGGIEGGCPFGLGLLEGRRTFGLDFGGKLGCALAGGLKFLVGGHFGGRSADACGVLAYFGGVAGHLFVGLCVQSGVCFSLFTLI